MKQPLIAAKLINKQYRSDIHLSFGELLADQVSICGKTGYLVLFKGKELLCLLDLRMPRADGKVTCYEVIRDVPPSKRDQHRIDRKHHNPYYWRGADYVRGKQKPVHFPYPFDLGGQQQEVTGFTRINPRASGTFVLKPHAGGGYSLYLRSDGQEIWVPAEPGSNHPIEIHKAAERIHQFLYHGEFTALRKTDALYFVPFAWPMAQTTPQNPFLEAIPRLNAYRVNERDISAASRKAWLENLKEKKLPRPPHNPYNADEHTAIEILAMQYGLKYTSHLNKTRGKLGKEEEFWVKLKAIAFYTPAQVWYGWQVETSSSYINQYMGIDMALFRTSLDLMPSAEQAVAHARMAIKRTLVSFSQDIDLLHNFFG